jgi:SAM-dependent methyltransferase
MILQQTLQTSDDILFRNGIFEQLNFRQNGFEENYVNLRAKENRLLADDQVLHLPLVSRDHPHAKEWSIRKSSANKLSAYIAKTTGQKNILEVGCGNGWLCNVLSHIDGAAIVGMDVNRLELEQAARVFASKKNVAFILGDIFRFRCTIAFDYIILPSSVQYFPSLDKLINNLIGKLSVRGEIHILDSPIYDVAEVENAQARSRHYFEAQNSEMHQHYHHHSWNDLKQFHFHLLHDPKSFPSKISRAISAQSPFPWIVITKKENEQ